jgi:hypothetical protein
MEANMRQRTTWVALLAVLSIAFAGCGHYDDPVVAEQPVTTGPAFAVTPTASNATVVGTVLLGGYSIDFDGRSYENDQTTFTYTVTRLDPTHAMNYFLIEIPACAPALASADPQDGSLATDPATGLYGVKWSAQLELNESRSYSMTFPGDVPVGMTHAEVKLTSDAPIGEIGGPCDGFQISGTVYVDADSSGSQSGSDEPGIPGVTVTMEDAYGSILTALTDANGDYAFVRFAGTYTIRIDAATSADDFNETLAANFDPTGATSVDVTIGPDSPGNDFGYDPQAKKITAELEAGTLLTTGEGPKYWIKQVRGSGPVDYDAATVAGFLSEIQGLYLPDPFQFTPDNVRREAIDVLKPPTSQPIDELLSELLAAEFNHVSGKGLVGGESLQGVLLSWAESWVVQYYEANPAGAASLKGGDPQLGGGKGTDASLDEAINLLGTLNGATGGGGSGGEG